MYIMNLVPLLFEWSHILVVVEGVFTVVNKHCVLAISLRMCGLKT